MGVGIRTDIQVLRGVAVLAVLVFHTFPEVLPYGLLGVDVFFVISGYLIGKMILSGLDTGTFSFREFYLRRARRLLPASFTTLLVTTLLAYPLLTAVQWRDYLWQLAGSLSFSTNFVLAWQSGYFDAASQTKPLLHMWSLAVEEQFYFVLPLALALIAARYRVWAIAAAALASLVLCVAMVSGYAPIGNRSAETLAFYMLPTRAWELLAGTLAGWLMLRREVKVPAAVKWLCLAIVCLLFRFEVDFAHPRTAALIATACTAVMLLGGQWMPRNPLEKIGDWSYSLYLVHWPLVAFAWATYLDTPPVWARLSLLALSLLLAWAQYRFIEQPFRHSARVVPLTVAAAAVVVLAAPGLPRSEPAPQLNQKGLGAVCDQKSSAWKDLQACATPGATVAVWGDSYAMHLVPALPQLMQFTKAACIPIPGVSQRRADYPVSWSRDCIAFNDSVLAAILERPQLKTVILSSPFAQVLQDRGQDLLVGGRLEPWSPVGRERLEATIATLQAAGRTVVLVGPTPSTSFDAGACNQRRGEGVLIAREDCSIERAAAEKHFEGTIEALRDIAARTGATLYLPFDRLCDETVCRTGDGAVSFYRDTGHLTPAGARYVLAGAPFAR